MNARERPWHAASRVGAGSGPLARPYGHWDVVLLRVYKPTSANIEDSRRLNPVASAL